MLRKIRQVGAELLYADRPTEVTKLTVDSAILWKRLKKTVAITEITRLGNVKGTQIFMVFHLSVFRITVLVFRTKPFKKLSVRCGQSEEYETSSEWMKCQSKGAILLMWPGMLSSIVGTSWI